MSHSNANSGPRLRGLVGWIPAVVWALLVALGLLIPGGSSEGPEWLERFVAFGGDKLVHAGLFFGQAWFLGPVWPARGTMRRAWWAAGVAALYGAALEVAQRVVPGRGFEPADLAANTVGALLFPLILVVLLRR